MISKEWLYSQDITVIILVLFVLFIAVQELGFRIGRKRSGDRKEDSQSQALEAAILTLFGLLLAFTFSMAANRYDLRRQIVVDEANAIGTAYLRARVLPIESRQRLQDLLLRYVNARLDV